MRGTESGKYLGFTQGVGAEVSGGLRSTPTQTKISSDLGHYLQRAPFYEKIKQIGAHLL